MSTIRVVYKGVVELVFESLDDAIAAAERLGTGHASHREDDSRPHSSMDGRWTLSRFKDFVSRLSEPQTKMLEELAKSPHGRTAKDLAQTMGLTTTKAFGPVLGAISRHAKKTGIGFNDIVRSERIDVGNESMLEFKATDAFRRMAAEAGWKVSE